jgi:hypothetical protein
LALPPTSIFDAHIVVLVWFVDIGAARCERTGIAAGEMDRENEFSFTMRAVGTAP